MRARRRGGLRDASHPRPDRRRRDPRVPRHREQGRRPVDGPSHDEGVDAARQRTRGIRGGVRQRLGELSASGRVHDGREVTGPGGFERPSACDAWARGRRRSFITGHSLGGALATLAAAYAKYDFCLTLHPQRDRWWTDGSPDRDACASRGLEVAALYTFGAPRVGDAALSENVRLRGSTLPIFRFVSSSTSPPTGTSTSAAGASNTALTT